MSIPIWPTCEWLCVCVFNIIGHARVVRVHSNRNEHKTSDSTTYELTLYNLHYDLKSAVFN